MSRTVADFLIERLEAWGVQRIFGYPGDGINGIIGALQRSGHIEFVLARHEEMAAFMACGHAKFTGEVGVCLATSGPGAIHLLNGLYDARMDHQPVLAIVGQQARSALGGSYQQEVDLLSLYEDVGAYVQMVTVPAQLPGVVDRALRIAMVERSVTCLIFPNDLQECPALEETPREHGFVPGSIGHSAPIIRPQDAEVKRAADVLNAGKRVAILVGQGARGAEAEVIEVADVLGAGVAKALLGKDVLPDDLPFVTGSIGLLGTKPSWDLMQDCDTLLMIGSSFPYSEFLPKWEQANAVQIDIDGRMIGLRYPMDVQLIGDSRETLRLLLPRLQRKTERGWQETIEKNVSEWWEVMEAQALSDADPLNPQRLFWELSPRLPDNCTITSDSGSSATWFARDIKIRRGMRASLSGNLATMGCGVPYAIAAKFAHPDHVAIALVGDGAMQMNGLNELITVAQYWRRWSDPRLIVLVLHNNDLNMVTWEQRAFAGDPRFEASQTLVDFPFARYAELIGLEGIRVDRADAVGDAWDRALQAERPVVIDAITDPNVPPLPPHISLEQAKAFMFAIAQEGEGAIKLIRRTVTAKWKEKFH
jgi:pyruvate dehydrogenase (quinone)